MHFGRFGPFSRAARAAAGGRAAQRRARFFFFFAFGPVAKPARVGAARAPRIPGRNLGLGRDSIRPPGPNLARAWPGQSGPSIQIRRSRAIFAGIKPWPPAATLSPNAISPNPFSGCLYSFPVNQGAPPRRSAGAEEGADRRNKSGHLSLPSFLSLPLPFSFATPQQEQHGPQRLHAADGGATMAPLAGARVRLRAVPSSGPMGGTLLAELACA